MRNLFSHFRILFIEYFGVGFGPWGRDFYPYFTWSKDAKSIPIGIDHFGFNLIIVEPTKKVNVSPYIVASLIFATMFMGALLCEKVIVLILRNLGVI